MTAQIANRGFHNREQLSLKQVLELRQAVPRRKLHKGWFPRKFGCVATPNYLELGQPSNTICLKCFGLNPSKPPTCRDSSHRFLQEARCERLSLQSQPEWGNGHGAGICFAGAVDLDGLPPGLAGVSQGNARIPEDLPPGRQLVFDQAGRGSAGRGRPADQPGVKRLNNNEQRPIRSSATMRAGTPPDWEGNPCLGLRPCGQPWSSRYLLVRGGKIPSQKVGRHWRFRRAAIDRWLTAVAARPADARRVTDRSRRRRHAEQSPTRAEGSYERGFPHPDRVDGPTAVHLTQSEQPDLVLLDVMMPGEDGFETCAAQVRFGNRGHSGHLSSFLELALRLSRCAAGRVRWRAHVRTARRYP